MTGDCARGDDELVHTASFDVESVLRDGVPDWERIEFDVCCARCGYNLRGLAQPRCPECGLEFEWALALRQAVSESDFLFEHQWRRRPIRSFVVTVWRSFRPRKFWRSVSIHERIEAGPLTLLLVISVVLIPVCVRVVGHGSLLCIRLIENYNASPYWWWRTRWRRVVIVVLNTLTALGVGAAIPLSFASRLAIAMAVMMLSVLGVILILRQTLRECRVRPVHVLRIVAYTAIPIALLETLVTMAGIGASRVTGGPYFVPHALLADNVWFPLTVVLSLAIPTIYLGAGLREYLGLPHARAIAFAAALVGLLCRGLVQLNL